MKFIKKYIFLLLLLLIPCYASAAGTASIDVSSASQGVVGNQLTVNVTISSSQALGSWELDVYYPKELLELSKVSSSDDCGSTTSCKGVVENSSTKSKKYTFTFKVKKSGSASINAVGTVYLYDETKTTPKGSKVVSLKTQAEIEASYSSDAYLKSITVTGYDLTPVFNKETYEYNVEVPNEVEKVTISAAKNDGNASFSGTGEKELKEGSNKFEIVCTAQKGNSLTYTVIVNRKELNPIQVTVKNKTYTLVRKAEELPAYNSFIQQTTFYGSDEIPALYNEGLNYTLIGVKDEEGNIYTYIYENESIKDEYYELTTGDLTILPKSIDEKIVDLVKKDFVIDGHQITGYAFKEDSKQVIINGMNVYNGEVNTYLYDITNKIFVPISLDDIKEINKKSDTFKLIIIILGVVVALLILLVIIKKPSKAEKKNKNKKVELDEEEIEVKEIEVEEPEEVKEEVKEEVAEEVVPEPPRLSRRAQKKIRQEEKKRLQELQKQEVVEELSEEQQQELEEEIKKKEEELKERKRKLKEKDEPKVEEPKEEIEKEVKEEKKDNKKKSVEDFVDEEVENEIVESDEVDDPLNDDDDFMEFWETMEIKTPKKKD